MTHRRAHQALTFWLELAKQPDLADAHVGVANNISEFGEAVILNISGELNTFADGLADFTEFISAEFS